MVEKNIPVNESWFTLLTLPVKCHIFESSWADGRKAIQKYPSAMVRLSRQLNLARDLPRVIPLYCKKAEFVDTAMQRKKPAQR